MRRAATLTLVSLHARGTRSLLARNTCLIDTCLAYSLAHPTQPLTQYMRAARDSGLTPDECVIIAQSSIEACWGLSDAQRAGYLSKLKAYCNNWRPKAKAAV